MTNEELAALYGGPVSAKLELVVVGERVFSRDGPNDWHQLPSSYRNPELDRLLAARDDERQERADIRRDLAREEGEARYVPPRR